MMKPSLSDEKLILVILNDRQSIGLPVVFYYPYFTEIDLEICYQRKILGSVKNVGVEDTPRISEPLSFFEKTLFSSAPTGVSHR